MSTASRSNGSGQDASKEAALLNAVGPAFSKLRRSNALLKTDDPIPRKDMSRTLVLGIVEEGPEASGQEVTVGVVAERMGVDPSVASRMVSDCISSGYVRRSASQQDGRRTILELTPDGEQMLERFRNHQRTAFEYITADWSKQDQLEFARLLIKYAETITALRMEQPADSRA
jgi:DNA-binding MarR family transcriptional regulator